MYIEAVHCIIFAAIVFFIMFRCIVSAIANYRWKKSNIKAEYDKLTKENIEKYNAKMQSLQESNIKLLDDMKTSYSKLKDELEAKYAQYMQDKAAQILQEQHLLYLILNEKKQSYPALAKVFADYETAIALQDALYLSSKSRPAKKSAEIVKEYATKIRELTQQNKELTYQVSYWENLFPWLEEFKEIDTDAPTITTTDSYESEYEALKSWLSPDEYKSLSTTQKYQLALDRYRQRKNKTRWEIGIEYERYIGYKFEKDGYHVEYRGALDGLNDMGRDLIVSKNGKTFVIQCKYWNKSKIIHEKHIFQLFGSVIHMQILTKNRSITGLFVTSASLSDIAKEAAEILNIKVFENIPMSYDYPCIKCNINRSTFERIYHLPFDQQYDKCIIRDKGEFYALTVQEAENNGFRRAHKWYGEN